MFNFLRRWFYKLSHWREEREINDWLDELEFELEQPINTINAISDVPYLLPMLPPKVLCKLDRTHIYIEDNNHYLQTSGAINLKRTCTKDKMVDGFIRNAPERSKMINNLIRERDRAKAKIGMANIMNRDSWLSQE